MGTALKLRSNEWKLAEAKNRLSEVVNRAVGGQPQVIHRRDDTVVVLSKQEYDRLAGTKPNFIEFLLSMPKGEPLELLPRDGKMREIDFD